MLALITGNTGGAPGEHWGNTRGAPGEHWGNTGVIPAGIPRGAQANTWGAPGRDPGLGSFRAFSRASLPLTPKPPSPPPLHFRGSWKPPAAPLAREKAGKLAAEYQHFIHLSRPCLTTTTLPVTKALGIQLSDPSGLAFSSLLNWVNQSLPEKYFHFMDNF